MLVRVKLGYKNVQVIPPLPKYVLQIKLKLQPLNNTHFFAGLGVGLGVLGCYFMFYLVEIYAYFWKLCVLGSEY